MVENNYTVIGRAISVFSECPSQPSTREKRKRKKKKREKTTVICSAFIGLVEIGSGIDNMSALACRSALATMQTPESMAGSARVELTPPRPAQTGQLLKTRKKTVKFALTILLVAETARSRRVVFKIPMW